MRTNGCTAAQLRDAVEVEACARGLPIKGKMKNHLLKCCSWTAGQRAAASDRSTLRGKQRPSLRSFMPALLRSTQMDALVTGDDQCIAREVKSFRNELSSLLAPFTALIPSRYRPTSFRGHPNAARILLLSSRMVPRSCRT